MEINPKFIIKLKMASCRQLGNTSKKSLRRYIPNSEYFGFESGLCLWWGAGSVVGNNRELFYSIKFCTISYIHIHLCVYALHRYF